MIVPVDIVADFVYEFCDNVRVSKNGTHWNARCPLCGDSKKSLSKRRFNMDWYNGNPGYHCFNCGRHGHFFKIYGLLKGMTPWEAEKSLYSFDKVRRIVETSKSRYKPKPPLIPQKEHSNFDYILRDCIGSFDDTEGYVQKEYKKALSSFMVERKVYDYPIFVAYKGDYKGRIVIPIYEDNQIIYFQARRISDNIEPKYTNPSVEKEGIILNREKFDRSKWIMVTEGILDALKIGDQATTILGVELSDSIIKTLRGLTDKGVIVCLDNDAPGKASLIELMERKASMSLNFFIMPYKYKHIEDISRLAVLSLIHDFEIEDIYKFVTDNSYPYFSAKVKIQMGV